MYRSHARYIPVFQIFVITYSIKSLLHFVTYSIFNNIKITTYSVFLHKIHDRENQMAHRKNRSKQDRREVLPVNGKEDKRQTGREGQQEEEQAPRVEAETVLV